LLDDDIATVGMCRVARQPLDDATEATLRGTFDYPRDGSAPSSTTSPSSDSTPPAPRSNAAYTTRFAV
jgi:hypothetical protein